MDMIQAVNNFQQDGQTQMAGLGKKPINRQKIEGIAGDVEALLSRIRAVAKSMDRQGHETIYVTGQTMVDDATDAILGFIQSCERGLKKASKTRHD